MTAVAAGSRRQAMMASRYGVAADGSASGDWNEVMEVIAKRHSVRSFLPDLVPRSDLEAIVLAAQSASTSSNLQFCSIVAVQDKERKQRIARLADNQRHIVEAPLLLAFVADLSRVAGIGERSGSPTEGLQYLESVITGFVDCALAAQNAVIAATSMGWGTCFIGALRNRPDAIAAELALPHMSVATFGLLVGKENPARLAAVKPRLPMNAVLHHEQYQPVPPDIIDRYDSVMDEFQLSQNMRPDRWSAKSVRRVGSADALHGREHLRHQLTLRGFSLQ